MSKNLIHITFIYIFLFNLFVQIGIFPGRSNILVDGFSLLVMLHTILAFAVLKKFYGNYKYLFLCLFAFVFILAGSILNELNISTIILGMRQYLKFFPFFFLPFVLNFNSKEIKNILLLLVGLLLFQLPMAIVQRFFIYHSIYTGDVVGGSIKHSGALSVLLIFGITIVYSFYLKERINLKIFLVLTILFFIPTAVNETKITFFLIPFAIILPIVLSKNQNFLKKLKGLFICSLMAIIFVLSFIYAYDKLYGLNRSFIDYLIQEKEGRGYVFQEKVEIGEINQKSEVGRFATLNLAYSYFSKEPLKIFFGTGVGTSKFRKIGFLETKDIDLDLYNPDTSTVSMLFWETGLIGLSLYFIFLLFLFKDAFYFRADKTFYGALGLGWASVCIITIPVAFYLNLFYLDVINVPFCFLSGVIVSKNVGKVMLPKTKNSTFGFQ
jgi:hypothetical protein